MSVPTSQGVVLAISVVLVSATAIHARTIVPQYSEHPLKAEVEDNLACDDADLGAMELQLDNLHRAIEQRNNSVPWDPRPDDEFVVMSVEAARLGEFLNHCRHDRD